MIAQLLQLFRSDGDTSYSTRRLKVARAGRASGCAVGIKYITRSCEATSLQIPDPFVFNMFSGGNPWNDKCFSLN